jgi:hypothetical protein
MRSLGIRVTAKAIHFAIVEKNENRFSIINVELIKVPQALDFPSRLKYIRNTVLDILQEYSIPFAGIRVVESNSKNISFERLQIEGVIQEAFASSCITSYFTGQMQSISRNISITTETYKEITTNRDSTFPILESWELCKDKDHKEAALVALGAFK